MNEKRTMWIVLGIIAIAVLLFLLLGRNPVQESATAVNQVASTTSESTERAAVRAEAAADLAALRARQEAGESYDSLRSSYAEIRTRVAASYENAEGAAQQEWTELSAEFDQFEASARAGTSNSLDLLARVIARLSADVRTETAAE